MREIEEVRFESLNDAEVQQIKDLLFVGFSKAACDVFTQAHEACDGTYMKIFGSGTSIARLSFEGGPVWDLFTEWFHDTTNQDGELSMPAACHAGSRMAQNRISAARADLLYRRKESVASKLGMSVAELDETLRRLGFPYLESVDAAVELRNACRMKSESFQTVCTLLDLSYRKLKRAFEHHRRLPAIRACLPPGWKITPALVRALVRISVDSELRRFVKSLDPLVQPSGLMLERAITTGMRDGTISSNKRGRKKSPHARAISSLATAIEHIRTWSPDFERLELLSYVMEQLSDAGSTEASKETAGETAQYGHP